MIRADQYPFPLVSHSQIFCVRLESVDHCSLQIWMPTFGGQKLFAYSLPSNLRDAAAKLVRTYVDVSLRGSIIIAIGPTEATGEPCRN